MKPASLMNSVENGNGEVIIFTPIALPLKTYNGEARLKLYNGLIGILTTYMKDCGLEGSEEALEAVLVDKISEGLQQAVSVLVHTNRIQS